MPRLQVFDDPFAPVIEEVDTGIPAGNVTITGNLAVNGNTTLGDAIGDSVTINGATVTATNAAIAAAALTTTGNITGSNITGNQLNSQTAINAVGNIVSSTGVVQGQGVAAILGLSGATLAISGNSTLGDAIGDTCGISGNATVGGTLDVSGQTTMAAAEVTVFEATTSIVTPAFGMGGAAPAARQTAIADGADSTVNAILAVLRTFGFIAP